MKQQGKRPKFAKAQIRATLSIDPDSLAEVNRRFEALSKAMREEIVRDALKAGGEIILAAAKSKAPGPYVFLDVLKASEMKQLVGKKLGRQVKQGSLYAVIGPDKDHWYYRFKEFGVQAHGVGRRKMTRPLQNALKNRVHRARVRTAQGRKSIRYRPALLLQGEVFAKRVRGFHATPFLRPAFDENQGRAIAMMIKVINDGINKALKSRR